MIREHQPDLIFLDVQIHNKTGFDLLQQVREKSFEVIFTPAYEKYAVQAFRFSAIDYLLKPIDLDDLVQAVSNLTLKKPVAELSHTLETLIKTMKKLEH